MSTCPDSGVRLVVCQRHRYAGLRIPRRDQVGHWRAERDAAAALAAAGVSDGDLDWPPGGCSCAGSDLAVGLCWLSDAEAAETRSRLRGHGMAEAAIEAQLEDHGRDGVLDCMWRALEFLARPPLPVRHSAR